MDESNQSRVPDDLWPIAVIARRWPGKDGGISPGAVFRFAKRGRRGVLLRVIEVPGVGLCSCHSWVREFIAACNATRIGRVEAPLGCSRKPRLRDRALRRPQPRDGGL